MIDKNLGLVDLNVDEVYGGSRNGNASDDPLPKLLQVDNGAGFRHLCKRPKVETLKMLALKTSFSDINWPDSLNVETGTFLYYGDNYEPGDLHGTKRQGNLILRNLFDETHAASSSKKFPPIFLFGNTGTYRDLRFLGLAVPGAANMSSDDDLVAVWRSSDAGVRFQNYKAIFTILDVPVISREWINDVQLGNAVESKHAPKPWLQWVNSRKYSALCATPTKKVRSKAQQLPDSIELAAYTNLLWSSYQDNAFAFEKCAMELAKLFLPNIHEYEITRPWRDGGRDAIGKYKLGSDAGAIDVEFAMEAKCYNIKSGVGVESLSRLISRLRHRQFGILVTTSYLDSQAYKELMHDEHPVVVISGGDLAKKLKEKFGSVDNVKSWIAAI